MGTLLDLLEVTIEAEREEERKFSLLFFL